MSPRPPRSTPFPYTTLFRSASCFHSQRPASGFFSCGRAGGAAARQTRQSERQAKRLVIVRLSIGGFLCSIARSEEHTSELQSQFHLVCRLLLEKKMREMGID